MGFLSFLQVICGVGSPVAIQTKAAIPPAFTLWLWGASLITGGSAKEKQRQFQNHANLTELCPQRNSYLKYLHELITKISEFLITKELSYLVVVTGGAELGVGIGNPKSSRSWSEISRTGSSHSDKLEKFSALKNWLELYKSWSLLRVLIKGFLELAKEGLLLMVG